METKNKRPLVSNIIYICAVVIPVIALVLRWPRIQKYHEINKLKLEKEKIVAEISCLNTKLDTLKWTREIYCWENSILKASWDVLRSEIAELDNSIIEIDNKLIELLDIKIWDSEMLLSEWKLLWNKYIVIHHTATPKDTTIQQIKDNWQRKYGRPAAHIVIDYSWNYEVVYDLTKNAWSTMNNWINNYAIQIELIWNFNEHRPSLAQYRELQNQISYIEEAHWKQEIIWHRDANPTACPWKYFDFSILEKDLSWYIEFNLSRYYSPVEWQEKYFSSIEWYFSQPYLNQFKRYSVWYEMDVCMNCWCQLDENLPKQLYDCTVPADWKKLKNEDAMKVIACPSEYKLWTKFYIEWLWEVVCRDRWWAITDNRIDVWAGFWQQAIDSWDKIIPWQSFGFILYNIKWNLK